VVRPPVLDRTPIGVVGLEIGAGRRPARHSHRLASSRSGVVLDTPVASAQRPPTGRRRHSTANPGDGRREPTLGRPSHPWGVVEAGVRDVRADSFSADAAAADPTLSELAHLPHEPPRLNRLGRLLRGAHAHLPAPVRLRRPRPRPPSHLARERDAASHVRVDSTAVTERPNAATEERLKSGRAVGGVSIV